MRRHEAALNCLLVHCVVAVPCGRLVGFLM